MLSDVLPTSQNVFVTAFTFLIVLVALLVRPSGLFAPLGQATADRV